MNRGPWLVAGLLALSLMVPPAAVRGTVHGPRSTVHHTQRPSRTCRLIVDTAGTLNVQIVGADSLYYIGRIFRAHCQSGGLRMQSDSAAWTSLRAELQLLGRVHVEDSVATLDADRMTYWVRTERILAEGNVYTRNRKSGSDMRGPNLDYYRAVPGIRDTLDLRGRDRPVIRFMPPGDSLKPDSLKVPFVIVADRVRLWGQHTMWGSGRVTIDRPDLSARADSAYLNLGDSLGWLIGAPVVTGRDTSAAARRAGRDSAAAYRLTGQRIRFDLAGDQQVRRVRSYRDARAEGPDWRLDADTLDMDLDSGAIQRTRAWGGVDRRPSAVSGASTITADSLDIRMPGQLMREVLAFGTARAAGRADTSRPEEDWLAGDTLRAAFAPPPGDTTRRRSEIERVTAIGGGTDLARALYHTDNERDPRGPRGINYSRGERITIAMREQKVRTVDIVGRVDGVYLEPLPPGRDSTVADSATAGAGTRGRGSNAPRDSLSPSPRPLAPARP